MGFRWAGARNALILRAGVIGAALALILTSASAVLGVRSGSTAIATVAFTTLLTTAVAFWVMSPGRSLEEERIGERWLVAAAFAAVAASYSAFSAVYEALLPGNLWPVVAVLLEVALPVYAIALLLPPLVHWGELSMEGEDEEDPEKWGAIGPMTRGALIGAFLGGLLSAFILIPMYGAPMGYLTAGVFLLAPIVFRDPRPGGTLERAIHRQNTPFGNIEITEVVFPGQRQAERRLYLNGEEESGQLLRSGAPTLAYIAAAERWLTSTTPPGSSYLFLGGGAFTLPRRIAESDSRAKITVVELDPAMGPIAERFFGLRPDPRLAIVQADARSYIDSESARRWDRIYLDVYAGTERLPYSLSTQNAAQKLARLLAPAGMLAVNLIGSTAEAERLGLWSTVRTYESAFASVGLYLHLGRDFPDRQNFMLLASNEAVEFPDEAGGFERWPCDQWPEERGSVIYRDVYETPTSH